MFAPAPSSRLMNGSLYSIARSLQDAALMCPGLVAEPPRIVKSVPVTITRRPSIRPSPPTVVAGVKSTSSWSAYWPSPASRETSSKLPGSSSALIRSRTVSLPRSC